MIKRKRYLIPVLFVAILMILVFAGCSYFYSAENKASWIVHRISSKLDLNEIQLVKLNDVKNEIMKHHEQHKMNQDIRIDELIVEVQKSTIERDYIQRLLNQRLDKIQQIAPIIIDKIVIFHESLTVMQKSKAVKLIENFRKRHQYFAS